MQGELTTRRLLAMIAAATVVAIGVIGMLMHVKSGTFDADGIQIFCGSGLFSDMSRANDNGIADQCHTALLQRRAWAIPAMVLGAAALAVLIARGSKVVNPRTAGTD